MKKSSEYGVRLLCLKHYPKILLLLMGILLMVYASEDFREPPIVIVTPEFGHVTISHVFSSYTINDEFRIVSQSWSIAAETAKEQGVIVEQICAVLPAEEFACPPYSKVVILKQKIENYVKGRTPLPTYGELFRVLRNSRGSYVMYSNADIGFVPELYLKVARMMSEDLTTLEYQKSILERTRNLFYKRCKELTVSNDGSKTSEMADSLCARDAIVYFENQGGRIPHFPRGLIRYFRNSSICEEEGISNAYDQNIPDSRTRGNAMTITRRQFPEAEPTKVLKELFIPGTNQMNRDVLNNLYEKHGESHPGNDVFVLPRHAIPTLLLETPFIHLRPSGFLIGQLLKDEPHLTWRRVMSSINNQLTFHVSKGTDEWPVRAQVHPRTVLFEAAHFFVRTNSTIYSFWPPKWCENGDNYREYGTGNFCGKVPGDYCRGFVRLTCTEYWHKGSRDRLALNTLCYQVSSKGKERLLDYPMCQFCNDLVGSKSYKCGKTAPECSIFPCS